MSKKKPGTFTSTGSSNHSKVLDPLHKGNAGDCNGSACTDNSVLRDRFQHHSALKHSLSDHVIVCAKSE
jgi:hypothetical protein